MTLAEFKAWFSGFTEDMDGPPSEKQWKRIKARVKEIDGVAVTKTVFIDHYVPPMRPFWSDFNRVYCQSAGSPDLGSVSFNAGAMLADSQFDGQTAMLSLGKAEYTAALNS